MNIAKCALLAGLALFSVSSLAKLPPPPPVDPKVAEEKAAKDKAAAEKTKADLSRYEDKAVTNFQANMRKQGKAVPKPTAIAVAAVPATPAAKPMPPAKK